MDEKRMIMKVLFIANSFADDTIEYMPRIAKDFGIDLEVHNLYIGGCSIETHINNILNNAPAYEYRIFDENKDEWYTKYNVSINETLENERWDIIVLQQCSALSGVKNGLEGIEKLIDLVDSHTVNKDYELIWNMTWSYPKENQFDVFRDHFNYDSEYMFSCIAANVKEKIIPIKKFKKIIPNGTAVENVRNVFTSEQIHRDYFHLTFGLGRYMAGLTAMKTIFDIDLSKTKYCPNGVSKEEKENAIKAANLADGDILIVHRI